MEIEEFKTFIEDFCKHADAQLDFSWRYDKDRNPAQLVSQLLKPEEATALLERLKGKQGAVNFTIVGSREAPGFGRLMVSTDSIKEINESIASKLNALHPIPEHTWKALTNLSGASFVGIKLGFSSIYGDEQEPVSDVQKRIFTHLHDELPKKLESNYGMSGIYEEHKRSDYFTLTNVSYTAYMNLLTAPSPAPSPIHALITHSVLNNAEEAAPAVAASSSPPPATPGKSS